MTSSTPTGTATGTHATVATTFGPFTVVVDDDGAVLASGWTDDVDALLPLVHPSLRPASVNGVTDLGELGVAVTAFHGGEPEAAATVPVRQQGGEFLAVVWDRMREIQAGAPVTYSELAERAGRPAAIRAAASACARNAAALFVPCHRVLRIGGGLGGFRWGTPLKASLIAMEAGPVTGAPEGPAGADTA